MALSGHHYTITAETWEPWVIMEADENDDFNILGATGIAMDIIDTISKKLNFTYKLVRPPDYSWGSLKGNGSYSGMVGQVQRKEVDIGVGPFSVTPERLPLVDFSISLHSEDFGIIIPRPKAEKDLGSFFNPFTWQVWLLVFASLIFGLIIGLVLEYIAKQYLEENYGGKFVAFEVEWFFKPLIEDGVSVMPTTDYARVLLLTYLLGGFILTAAFKSILTSLLIVPKVTIPANSLVELVQFGKIPWSIHQGTGMKDGLYSSGIPEEKIFADEAGYINDCIADRNLIVEENRAFTCDKSEMLTIIEYEFDRSATCKHYILEKRMYSTPMGFIFQKNSSIKVNFDKWYGLFNNNGLLQYMIAKATPNASHCLVPPGREKHREVNLTLSIKDLSGVFLILAGGYVVALIGFAVEIVFSKFF